METRPLGQSGLRVPAVGMGTWQTFNVRGAAALANARAVVDAALASGANLFDSSPMYGEAEDVLAQALGDRRQQALIATKVWSSSQADGRKQIDRALKLYGGRVDLYQIHNLLSWQPHLPVLESLKNQGKIQAIGATHYSAGAFEELARLMRTGRIAAIPATSIPGHMRSNAAAGSAPWLGPDERAYIARLFSS